MKDLSEQTKEIRSNMLKHCAEARNKHVIRAVKADFKQGIKVSKLMYLLKHIGDSREVS